MARSKSPSSKFFAAAGLAEITALLNNPPVPKWVKFIIAILLLPVCVAAGQTLWMVMSQCGGADKTLVPIAAGAACWVAIFLLLPKPMWIYVVGHELTHAVWVWLFGGSNSVHLGASGLTHGLMFLLFVLGLLRRDRAAIAAGMLAFAFYGGMLMTILPREAGVSWESHLGGALAGVIAAFLFRRSDPLPPRQKYSWEIEEELTQQQAALERDMYEPRAPQDVPVLWQRDAETERGRVLPFPSREPPAG